jgi:putative sterol carrier protein
MTITFPSDMWIKALMEDLNASQAYQEAARNWEGDFFFVIELNGGSNEKRYLYMDLWHGKCRNAYEVKSPADHPKTAFLMSGSLVNWKKIITRKLDPIQAMMTNQLKLQGNMAMIMKSVRAAKELVECCTRIPTDYLE